jgi:hypothetical protein
VGGGEGPGAIEAWAADDTFRGGEPLVLGLRYGYPPLQAARHGAARRGGTSAPDRRAAESPDAVSPSLPGKGIT